MINETGKFFPHDRSNIWVNYTMVKYAKFYRKLYTKHCTGIIRSSKLTVNNRDSAVCQGSAHDTLHRNHQIQ